VPHSLGFERRRAPRVAAANEIVVDHERGQQRRIRLDGVKRISKTSANVAADTDACDMTPVADLHLCWLGTAATPAQGRTL